MRARHEIGGYSVEMTEHEARRWNDGDVSPAMLDQIQVHLAVNDRYISLRRATCRRLEPEVADAMDGMPANRCGDWHE